MARQAHQCAARACAHAALALRCAAAFLPLHSRRNATNTHTHRNPHNRRQVPGLAVVIVGERKDSQTYVRMKRRACAEVGFRSIDCDLPGDATQAQVVAAVRRLNADPDVHGILVQLPVSACCFLIARARSRACGEGGVDVHLCVCVCLWGQ